MVGFLRDPTVDEELDQQSSELKKPDLSVFELDEFSLSFADSLLDFDCLGDWIEEIPVMDSNSESEKVVGSVEAMEVKVGEGCLGMEKNGSCVETGLGVGFQELGDSNASIDGKQVLDTVGLDLGLLKVGSVKMEVEDVEGGVGVEKDGSFREAGLAGGFQREGDLSSCIEEGIGNFNLDGGLEENGRNGGLGMSVADSLKSVEAASGVENGVGAKLIVNGDGEFKRGETVHINEGGGNIGEMVTVNGGGTESDEIESDGDESDSSSGSSSASSSSSSAGSEEEEEEDDEEEEGKEKEGQIDMEEGEIRDPELEQMMGLSDDEDEDDTVTKGPIKSKNELQVNDGPSSIKLLCLIG